MKKTKKDEGMKKAIEFLEAVRRYSEKIWYEEEDKEMQKVINLLKK